jgi:hypothetical protein
VLAPSATFYLARNATASLFSTGLREEYYVGALRQQASPSSSSSGGGGLAGLSDVVLPDAPFDTSVRVSPVVWPFVVHSVNSFSSG